MNINTGIKISIAAIGMVLVILSVLLYLFLIHFDPHENGSTRLQIPDLDIKTFEKLIP